MKQIIIAACLINYLDDRGGVHQDVGDIIDVPKHQAENLARAERTLYVERKDDPTKAKQFTASEAMLKAAEDLAKAKAEETTQTAAQAKAKADPVAPNA